MGRFHVLAVLCVSEARLEEFRGYGTHRIEEHYQVRECLDEDRKVALLIEQFDQLDEGIADQGVLVVETLLGNRSEATSVPWVELDVDLALEERSHLLEVSQPGGAALLALVFLGALLGRSWHLDD